MSFVNPLKLRQKLSLRSRLTLLYVFIFGLTTIGFNVVLFRFTLETLQSDFDDALFNYAVDITDSIKFGPRGVLTVPVLDIEAEKILPFPLGTALIQVRHETGKILTRVGPFGDFEPPFESELRKIKEGQESSFLTLGDVEAIPDAEARSYRVISVPLGSVDRDEPVTLLQIAVPLTLMEAQIQNRLQLMQVGFPLVILVAILAGLFLSSRALAPLNKIISAAQAIDASELSSRVPTPATQDEIRALALTLNEMLERIEKAFQSQERFVAEASHQLLSPVTLLKMQVERLEKNPATGEVRESLWNLHQEVDHLSAIIQDMLLLARIESGLGALNRQNLELDEVVGEALSRCEEGAKEKDLRLVFDLKGDLSQRRPVSADRDLLIHLFRNLIENAVKYSPAKALIRIELEWTVHSQTVRILDEGPGLSEDLKLYLFEAFRRGRETERKVAGYGLGLAICKKIADLHQVQIKAHNRSPKGAEFSVEWPFRS